MPQPNKKMISAGLLDLLDELTSGALIMPRGHQLNPTEEAVAWADSEAEQVPVEAWPVLGVPGASAETSLVGQAMPLFSHFDICVFVWVLVNAAESAGCPSFQHAKRCAQASCASCIPSPAPL